MSENLNVLRLVGGELRWYRAGSTGAPEPVSDPGVAGRLAGLLAERREAVVFAAPGEDVRLVALTVTAEEKKHLSASLPFMLEEAVAEDIEALHVAGHHRGDLAYTAMLCRHACMAAWAEALAVLPPVRCWTPEPLLLPWRAGEWCLLVEGDRALLRHGAGAGTAVERDLLPPLLEALLAGGETPDALVVYGEDQTADTALLPAALAGRCQWRRGGFAQALWLTEDGERPNLRQGEYAPRLPLGRWWTQWQRVAVVLGVAFALQLAATAADYRQLRGVNLSLREAIQTRYREAYPRGAVVDAETQLRRQLEALKGSGQSSGFTRLLARVGAVVHGQRGTAIESLNYSQRGSELRLNIRAPDFGAVERVRSGLAAAGVDAIMESSTNDGDGVRARLRVGGRS
ncbi:type II secretion system protein GspL [Pseudohaliea rubra]|uniref:Type II secretion system protein L n=1 Tax=Pseudohaliea rubra DSM 19751 TaxID=1265313 RepID=A0A095Y014_9GAMM|nr:type II secretion system protein GspL [Pseudohaliea rubra]KGE05371.1 General secretion pathway protein L [Pseudohaliea rubra DSM 19751]